MSRYDAVQSELREHPRHWLVTGAAGFIGSHITETLLRLGQRVTGLDNFATGRRSNLEAVAQAVGSGWSRFNLIEGDIRNPAACAEACAGVEVVVHQAALGSVPRSIADPASSHASNVDGFVNMLIAVRNQGVERFVYASSSSVYGDHPTLPKQEDQVGRPLSPYALTKSINEQYADVFGRTYGIRTVGLRYFNVFGPRQDPESAYAAVIPRWVSQLIRGEPCEIFGDGETSRDFCYVANTVQANLLAATTPDAEALGTVYNVACGGRTTLVELHRYLAEGIAERVGGLELEAPRFRDFRPGDVRHSQADISKAQRLLGYEPTHSVREGIAEALDSYVADATGQTVAV
jgi:UDP-N-acetylglucosamine/UDP-N-acetylgalactosamine 4-epimerase